MEIFAKCSPPGQRHLSTADSSGPFGAWMGNDMVCGVLFPDNSGITEQ
jgi:hypothetical protein